MMNKQQLYRYEPVSTKQIAVVTGRLTISTTGDACMAHADTIAKPNAFYGAN